MLALTYINSDSCFEESKNKKSHALFAYISKTYYFMQNDTKMIV